MVACGNVAADGGVPSRQLDTGVAAQHNRQTVSGWDALHQDVGGAPDADGVEYTVAIDRLEWQAPSSKPEGPETVGERKI